MRCRTQRMVDAIVNSAGATDEIEQASIFRAFKG
jgi:hypothetical protein